mgnify:CR=1 FL=1
MEYSDYEQSQDSTGFWDYFGWLWGVECTDDPTPVTESDNRPVRSGVIIIPQPTVTPRHELQDNGRVSFDLDDTQKMIITWNDEEYKQ